MWFIRVITCYMVINFITNVNALTVNLTIADGDIKGLVNSTIRENVTYYNFRGIPYAKPPVGDLRFANPEKNAAWNGTWDATYDRTECIQFDGDDYIGTTIYGQEDCLYINAYTPDINATKLPVLVWIHGGTFIHGNSSYEKFGPDYFLEQGLVFVSFNYRLGIFGFFSTEDEACPGNWGIKDQILALKWVQKNVAYFGGDPDNVTIFGESAGSVSVHLLLQTNLTKGLFSKAIMNSGSTLNLWGLNTRAAKTATVIGLILGIDTTNSTELVAKLRDIDAEELQDSSWLPSWGVYVTDGLRGLPFGPVMEPQMEGAVYVNPSDYALTKGYFHKVPILMGFNSNEAAAVQSVPFYLKTYIEYYDVVENLLTPWSFTRNSVNREAAGVEIKTHYFGLELLAANTSKLITFISADQFNRPIRRAAADMSNYTNVYFYEFGYQGALGGIADRTLQGTGHAEDLSYLFRSTNSYTAQDIKVSETMVHLWSNFAKYGKPIPETDTNFNGTSWDPVNSTSSDFNFMWINASLAASVNPKQEDWAFYQTIWTKYGDKSQNLTTY